MIVKSYCLVADPENFGGGDFKNFKHKTSKIRMSSLKWRLIFWPKSEIRMFFPPKFRRVFIEIETDFSEIQTSKFLESNLLPCDTLVAILLPEQ